MEGSGLGHRLVILLLVMIKEGKMYTMQVAENECIWKVGKGMTEQWYSMKKYGME